MSIFGNIMGAIFGHGSPQANVVPTSTPSTPVAPVVDVADIVDKAAAAKGEKLAWRTSIVDLMKALGLDSSLTARKQLASELKYSGDVNELGHHECLAAQADHGQTGGQWRQAAGRHQSLNGLRKGFGVVRRAMPA